MTAAGRPATLEAVLSAKRAHWIAGLLALFAFLFTGYYMRARLPELSEHDRVRFSLRGSHIYILLAALLNLSLGAYLRWSTSRPRAALQAGGSLLILAATALLVVAFFVEPKEDPSRPMTLAAMISVLSGTALHAAGSREKA